MKWYERSAPRVAASRFIKAASPPMALHAVEDAGAELPHPPGWSELPPPPAAPGRVPDDRLARYNTRVLLQALRRAGAVEKKKGDEYVLRPGRRRTVDAAPNYNLGGYISSRLQRDHLYRDPGLREYYYVVNSADLPGAEDLPLAYRMAGPFSRALERTIRQIYPGLAPSDRRVVFRPFEYFWSFDPIENRIIGRGAGNWRPRYYVRPPVFPFLHEVHHAGSPMTREPHTTLFFLLRGGAPPGWRTRLAKSIDPLVPKRTSEAARLMEEGPARFSELIPLLIYHRNELQQAGVDPDKALRRLPLPPYDSAAHFLADVERFGLIPGTKSYDPQANVADYMVKSPYARKLIEISLQRRPFPVQRLVRPMSSRGVATGPVPSGQVRYVTDPYTGKPVDLNQWQSRLETPFGLQLNWPTLSSDVLEELRTVTGSQR